MSRAARLATLVPDLAVGGLQAMAVGLVAALDRAAFSPVVYTFDAGGPLEDELSARDVPHVHLPRRPGIDRGHAARLARRFRDDGIGLVHCHNVTALFHGARAAYRAGRLPVLYTEHDREMPAPWRHRLLHRWLARRRTHAIVVVSEALRRDLLRYEGFPARRTTTLVNGIPDPLPSAPDRESARRELGWDGGPVLLSVGSLTPVKNHEGLLRIAATLRRDRPGLRVAIAGEGPLHDRVAAAAADAPEGAVDLLGRRDDVPRLLAACDVFVLPSHREGLPLCLVEAHAMGRPSVAYAVGGNGEVVEDAETGRLVPPGDEAAFAGAVGSLLDDPARRDRLGAAARRRYLDRFTHERMVAGYTERLAALASGRAG